MPSQPLDVVGSSDETASNTPESVKDTVHMQEGGRGRVLMSGREKELPVETAWVKKSIKEFGLARLCQM